MCAVNFNSEADCRRAYLNYHCHGNTMNLTANDMGRICGTWSDKLSDWQKSVTADKNDYDFDYSFDDTKFKTERNEGYKEAQKETGFKNDTGDKVDRTLRAPSDAIGTTAATVAAYKFGAKLTQKAGEKIASDGAQKVLGKTVAKGAGKAIAKEGAEKTVSVGNKSFKTKGNYAVMAATALAIALVYKAKKPNKEEYEALKQLYNEYYPEANEQIAETQEEMNQNAENIAETSDKANTENEEANSKIEEEKATYDMYMRTFLAIQKKVDEGQPLTTSEQKLYNSVIDHMNKIAGEGGSIESIMESSSDEINSLYGEMSAYQDSYDSCGEKIANIKGHTDFAAGFDKATKLMCNIEAVAQGINLASAVYAGVVAAARLVASWGTNVVAWGALVASGVAGGISGKGMVEQRGMAKDIDHWVDARKGIENYNKETQEIYDFEIDSYNDLMHGVEDLEVEVPKNTETVEAGNVTIDDGKDSQGTNSGNIGGSITLGYNPKKAKNLQEE